MTWTETHRYYRTLREIEAALDRRPDASTPWRDEWSPLFGDRRGLALALLTRWRRIIEAQHEVSTVAELAAAHPGLAALAGLDVRGSFALAAS